MEFHNFRKSQIVFICHLQARRPNQYIIPMQLASHTC